MDLFLWRRTDFRGQRYLPEIYANASPAAFDTLVRGLDALARSAKGQRSFPARKPTKADDARIHHETDHRSVKPTTKKPYAGDEPERILRAAGCRVEWLTALDIRWDRNGSSSLERRGTVGVLELGDEGRLELKEACEGQRQGWGNDGCFGIRLSFGLCFAPDWLGVE